MTPRSPHALRWLARLTLVAVLLSACGAGAAPTPSGVARPSAPGKTGPTATPNPATTVVVTHWAAGELMSPTLLPAFASAFNAEKHKTASGKTISVSPVLVNSGRQAELLTARVGRGVSLDPQVPDPVLVTPSVDHWLSQVNQDTGKTVVDLTATQDLAIAWVGIATFREMAECLGWPGKEIGFADLIALKQNPKGWASCPTAKAEWGQEVRLPFSDPATSSTARSALFALYALAANKPTDQLTPEDVAYPKVVEFVKKFQAGVDHYVPDTLVLQSKMYQGPRYGSAYIVEENTLVQLYQGKLPVTVGAETKPQPLSREMVFIYPKEGTYAHNHPAGVVKSDWVTPEQAEAARAWVDYLRRDEQQRAFMQDGFRPATAIPYGDTISPRFGLDPTKPSKVLKPVNPAAATRIMAGWGEVKRPGVAALVVDVSGSMKGQRLEQAKEGSVRLLSAMNARNSIGLLAFSDGTKARVPVGPLGETQFEIERQVRALQAVGGTGLYDAIAEAIKMVDDAPGDPEAIRGVVVLTDGEANFGKTNLSDLVKLTSRGEAAVPTFRGWADDKTATDASGAQVAAKDLIGVALASPTRHPIHVFFVGVGEADVQVGRLLAEATGSSYQTSTEAGLAAALERLGRYF
jgi:Ca-activated chloride channel family protein